MSSPDTRPRTEDEELMYDSGLIDGRAEENTRIVALLTQIRDEWERMPAMNFRHEMTKVIEQVKR